MEHVIAILIFGFFSFIIGIYIIYKISSIKKNGIKTNGELIYYYEEKNSDSDIIYSPVYRFKDKNGNVLERKSIFGSSIKKYKELPIKLDIYYQINKGNHEVISENKNFKYLAYFLIVLGLVFFLYPFIKQLS